ncbi:hypothetical protein Hanom_Chr02g00108951 [Helianthus anomalus]
MARKPVRTSIYQVEAWKGSGSNEARMAEKHNSDARYILDAGRRSSIIEEPNTIQIHASAHCKSIFLKDEFWSC